MERIYGTKTVEEYKIKTFLNKHFLEFKIEVIGRNEIIFTDKFGTVTVMKLEGDYVFADGCNLGKWNM